MAKHYRITERVSVERVYNVEAADEEAAIDKVMSGTVEPTTTEDGQTDINTELTYPIRYRGGYKNDGAVSTDDPKVGTIEYWTMGEILAEINRDRSPDWSDYDETDWKEGLDEWTWYEPVNED